MLHEGLFYAELNDFFLKHLSEDGYSGLEIRKFGFKTEVIIRAARTQAVLGEKGRRIRELESVVIKRWGFKEGAIQLFAERTLNRGLSASFQADSLKFKLYHGLAIQRAVAGVMRFSMENGADGIQVIVSGKLVGQRARASKFQSGYLVFSGDGINHYVDRAVRSITMRQGVLGIQLKILLPFDPTGKLGPAISFPDFVDILEPKEITELPLSETHTQFTPLPKGWVPASKEKPPEKLTATAKRKQRKLAKQEKLKQEQEKASAEGKTPTPVLPVV